MSELDKYFEKARNVEPIYEEDDAKKLLYGKLSDGGIATNLYNKIKVFPMITALITSVATIATIAFFSMTSPNEVVEQPNIQKHKTVSSVNSTNDTDELKEKKIITRSIIANHNTIDEKETAKTKEKAESKTWTDNNKIDIKSVNSLKLTKDELAQLGIVIDDKSFKINAFDKYTYTINQNNEKQRDYYDTEKDRDALPTPAMVTTSTGFKTLTLFKKGNVEATVDRYKSSSSDDVELVDYKGFPEDFDWQKRFGDAPQYNMNNQSFADYKKSLSGYKDSAAIVELMESYEELEIVVNGKKTTIDVQEILRNANGDDKELMKKIMQESFVVDNESSDNLLDFSINVKRNGTNEVDKLLNLNVGNTSKMDFSKIELDSTEMSKIYTFDKQMKDYIAKSKDSNPNQKNIPDDLARALDSILKNNKIAVDPDFQRRLDASSKNKDFHSTDVIIQEGTVVNLSDELMQSKQNEKPYVRDLLQRDSDKQSYNRDLLQRDSDKQSYNRDLLQRESDNMEVINISEDDIKVERSKNSVYRSIDFTKFYDVSTKFKNAPEYDFKKGIEKYKLLLIGNIDSAEIIKEIQKPKSFQYESERESFVINSSKNLTETRHNDKLNSVNYDLNINRNNDNKIKIITEVYEESENANFIESDLKVSSPKNKKYEITLDGKTFSIDYDKIIKDGKLDQIKYKEFMLGVGKELGQDINVDSELSGTSSNKIEKYELNVNTELEENVYTVPMGKLIIEDGETEHKFELKPGQSIWADENQDGVNKAFRSNMSLDFINYNINELIPIEISFDGVNTDFIVWYEATDDFLSKLPTKIKAKINPELMALTEQMDHCENEPIEKKETVMDVWSGCSGAIKEMKVFPNPTTSNSNVEFELQDSRVISIAIFDLSGKLIKNVKSGMSIGKGNTKELLNLTGINPGLYYVVVKSEKGEQALQRIIIE